MLYLPLPLLTKGLISLFTLSRRFSREYHGSRERETHPSREFINCGLLLTTILGPGVLY